MTMYAGNAGKSGGEFFTPQEVSELLARITVVGKKEVNKVYDPACGSGAFPMGLLRELFLCRSAIEPNIMENAANIKRHIIQNNI